MDEASQVGSVHVLPLASGAIGGQGSTHLPLAQVPAVPQENDSLALVQPLLLVADVQARQALAPFVSPSA